VPSKIHNPLLIIHEIKEKRHIAAISKMKLRIAYPVFALPKMTYDVNSWFAGVPNCSWVDFCICRI